VFIGVSLHQSPLLGNSLRAQAGIFHIHEQVRVEGALAAGLVLQKTLLQDFPCPGQVLVADLVQIAQELGPALLVGLEADISAIFRLHFLQGGRVQSVVVEDHQMGAGPGSTHVEQRL